MLSSLQPRLKFLSPKFYQSLFADQLCQSSAELLQVPQHLRTAKPHIDPWLRSVDGLDCLVFAFRFGF